MMDVDSTPERVEFENSLELLSEDDLLTSELEEEELAQKNLGAIDVATSDDEYSDLRWGPPPCQGGKDGSRTW